MLNEIPGSPKITSHLKMIQWVLGFIHAELILQQLEIIRTEEGILPNCQSEKTENQSFIEIQKQIIRTDILAHSRHTPKKMSNTGILGQGVLFSFLID